MTTSIRIWEVQEGDRLSELGRAPLDLEGRIEGWLEQ